MNYLLDTNVVSELARPKPNPAVVDWFAHKPAESLYLSVLTLGEIRKGIAKLPDGPRKRNLSDWLAHDLPSWFSNRILTIDAGVAECWGNLQAQASRPLPAIDSLLAATAIQHSLCLVTRNVRDFAHPGLTVFNPWQEQ